MSGLRKAKKYDWKDSNLALFGSDVEKNVRAKTSSVDFRDSSSVILVYLHETLIHRDTMKGSG